MRAMRGAITVSAMVGFGALLLRTLHGLGEIGARMHALEQELVLLRLTARPAKDLSSSAALVPVAGDRSPHPLSNSKINRNGLDIGTLAPVFEAVTVDGRSWRLTDTSHVRRLLLFTSTDCKPCEAVLDELLAAPARYRLDRLRLIIVARGASDDIRQKYEAASAIGDVVQQRSWEVARLYGTFTLPSAYIIGTDDRLETGLLVGVNEIASAVTAATDALSTAAAHA